MELDELAKVMSTSISKMTPPYEDKKGDTFWDGQKGCFPFGGYWGELSYCSECYWQNCCQKKRIDWIFIGGDFAKNTEN